MRKNGSGKKTYKPSAEKLWKQKSKAVAFAKLRSHPSRVQHSALMASQGRLSSCINVSVLKLNWISRMGSSYMPRLRVLRLEGACNLQ